MPSWSITRGKTKTLATSLRVLSRKAPGRVAFPNAPSPRRDAQGKLPGGDAPVGNIGPGRYHAVACDSFSSSCLTVRPPYPSQSAGLRPSGIRRAASSSLSLPPHEFFRSFLCSLFNLWMEKARCPKVWGLALDSHRTPYQHWLLVRPSPVRSACLVCPAAPKI